MPAAAAACGEMRDFWCMAEAETICADDICCIDCSAFSRCDWSMYDAGLPLDGTCKGEREGIRQIRATSLRI